MNGNFDNFIYLVIFFVNNDSIKIFPILFNIFFQTKTFLTSKTNFCPLLVCLLYDTEPDPHQYNDLV